MNGERAIQQLHAGKLPSKNSVRDASIPNFERASAPSEVGGLLLVLKIQLNFFAATTLKVPTAQCLSLTIDAPDAFGERVDTPILAPHSRPTVASAANGLR
jgi:hypothetical protein